MGQKFIDTSDLLSLIMSSYRLDADTVVTLPQCLQTQITEVVVDLSLPYSQERHKPSSLENTPFGQGRIIFGINGGQTF